MGSRQRPNKKLARYEQDEIDAHLGKATSIRNGVNEFITMKELPFKLNAKQKELIKLIPKNRIIAVTGPPGTSKAQPLSAKLLTPTGWTTMGEIKVGDEVIGVNGIGTKVLGIFPQGKKQIYKITFSDGSSTECTGDHLWLTWNHSERVYYKKENGKKIRTEHSGTVRTTEELIPNLYGNDGRLQYSIPIVKPIEFVEKQYNINPYLIGALIGDGHLGNYIGFSTNDNFLYEKINNLLFLEGYKLAIRNKKNDFVECAIVKFEKNNNENKFKTYLNELNLLNTKSHNKFIPEEYLFGSIEQRISLLQGLMDTDGYVSKNTIAYSTSSELLKNDFIKLIQSLGGVCSYSIQKTSYMYNNKKYDGLPHYVISIRLPEEIEKKCFTLQRKLDKIISKTKYKPVRYIASITPIYVDDAQCIMVEDENHLYVTDDYIVTHNTFLALYAAIQAFMSGKCKKIILSKPTEVLSGTKDLGALPGTLDEKMQVYIESFLDAFDDILTAKDFKHLWTEKIIEFKPAQFLRGRTIKDAYIIIDEFQNFDIKALKSIITRLGRGSTMIFMGDTKQNDINKKFVAIETLHSILDGLPNYQRFHFMKEDIVREQLLIDIVTRFELFEDNDLMPETIKGA